MQHNSDARCGVAGPQATILNSLPNPFGVQLISYAQAATTTLQLSKTGPIQANQGESIVYTITLTNTTGETATGVIVDDIYPGFTGSPSFLNLPPDWLPQNLGDRARWRSADAIGGNPMPPNSKVNFLLQLTIDSPLPNGTIIYNDNYTALATNALTVTGSP